MQSDLKSNLNPLLITESRTEYEAFRTAVIDEIKPRTTIEEILVENIIEHSWYIRRLRRARAQILNIGTCKAIALLVEDSGHQDNILAEQIASQWFKTKETKVEVANLLQRHNLDESAIAAEAIKMNAPTLERLGNELAVWEKSRNKAIRKQMAQRVS